MRGMSGKRGKPSLLGQQVVWGRDDERRAAILRQRGERVGGGAGGLKAAGLAAQVGVGWTSGYTGWQAAQLCGTVTPRGLAAWDARGWRRLEVSWFDTITVSLYLSKEH
jgi:hypothetical protein